MSDGTKSSYGKQSTPISTAMSSTFNFISDAPLVGLWGFMDTGVKAIGVVQLN